MRLHALRFGAIGPFPGEHDVDLDALGASGLFLLEGPTGAGKSTLIDAIVFALYGQVAAEGSVVTRMRSDHAQPGTPSYVELTFSTDEGIFRVRRTPDYERPKKRGEGMVTERSSVSLVRLAEVGAEAGQAVSSRADEVALEIERLVGLTRQQFTQVVVLPQGQFARFLRATTDERAAVLQTVFGTQLFEQVQSELKQMAAAASGERDAAAAQITEQVQRFLEVVSPDAEVEGQLRQAAEELKAERLTGLVEAEVSRLTDAAASAASNAQAREARWTAATAVLTEQQQRAQRLKLRSELVAQRAELAAQADEMARITAQVDQARRAATVLPLARSADLAETQAAAAVARLPELRASLLDGPDADLAEGLEGTAQITWAERIETARDEALGAWSALASQEKIEGALPARRTRLAADEAELPARREAIVAREQEVSQTVAHLKELQDQATVAQEAAGDLEQAREDEQHAAQQMALCASLHQVRERRERAAAELDAAADRAQGLVAEEAQLRSRWIAGLAGRLAGALVLGEPCPVCGSAEHPQPARLGEGEQVTDDELEAAERQSATAREKVAALGEQHDSLVDEVDRLAEQAPEPAAVETALQQARGRVTAAQQAAARAKECARSRDRAQHQLDELRSSLAALHVDQAKAETELVQRRQDIEESERAVLEARGEAPTVAARRSRLHERAEAARILAAAVRRVVTTEETRVSSQAQLAEALQQQALPDAGTATAVALPEPEIKRLERLLTDHGQAWHSVEQRLAAPEIAVLTGDEKAEVEAASDAAETARQAHEQAVSERTRAQDAASRAQKVSSEITRGLRKLASTIERTGPVVRMAELASGQGANTSRLVLATFVLVKRFEEVLAAANLRLNAMTHGRYALVRTEGREKGSRALKTGLGIDVIDHETDRPRSPASLSGGETFQFSLALALGLADVVTAENSSIEMGTLFVDEGFGSLDPAALEVVMRELTALHDRGNRAVGVVSHVSEMKGQIAERIEVRRGDRGSTLRVIA